MRSQMLLVLSASFGAVTVQAQQDDSAVRALSNVRIKTVAEDCFVLNKQSTGAKQPVERSTCGAQQDERWDVIKSGKHNNEDRFLIIDTVTQKCLTFEPAEDYSRRLYVAPCDSEIDGSKGLLTSQFFALDRNEKVTRLQSLNEEGRKCVFPWWSGFSSVSCQSDSAKLYVIGEKDSNGDN